LRAAVYPKPGRCARLFFVQGLCQANSYTLSRQRRQHKQPASDSSLIDRFSQSISTLNEVWQFARTQETALKQE
jgi:hypothetical protein